MRSNIKCIIVILYMYNIDSRYIQRQIEMTPIKASSSNVERSIAKPFSSGESNIRKQMNSSIATPPSIIIQLNDNNILDSQTEIIPNEFKALPFSRRYYLLEVLLTYSFLIAINYLIKLLDLQYIAIIACIALFETIGKFKHDHLLIFCVVPILIGNCFMGTQILSALQILCAYVAVSSFQSLNFMDRLYPIISCLILAAYGFIALPIIYSSLSSLPYGKYVYFYIFPFVDFVVELICDILILQLQNPSTLHFMISLCQVGIYFGTAMSVSISSVQFWYLCLLLSIKAIACRQQVVVQKLRRWCYKLINKQKIYNRNISYKSGYLIKTNIHIVLLVYIYGYLNFSNNPFTYLSSNIIDLYQLNWYQPLIFALLSSFYDVILLIINRKKPDYQKRILLQIRKTSQKTWRNLVKIAYYSLINIFGLWMFYLGYCIPSLFLGSASI